VCLARAPLYGLLKRFHVWRLGTGEGGQWYATPYRTDHRRIIQTPRSFQSHAYRRIRPQERPAILPCRYSSPSNGLKKGVGRARHGTRTVTHVRISREKGAPFQPETFQSMAPAAIARLRLTSHPPARRNRLLCGLRAHQPYACHSQPFSSVVQAWSLWILALRWFTGFCHHN
jgi:hypothetical protein